MLEEMATGHRILNPKLYPFLYPFEAPDRHGRPLTGSDTIRDFGKNLGRTVPL